MIKLLVVLMIFAFASCEIDSTSKANCGERSVEDCSSTEYNSYVDCIRKRTKRNADCYSDCEGGGDCGGGSQCGECDCGYCSYHDCSNQCESCCQSSPPPCQTRNCCHQTCNNQCRTLPCRRTCRSRCVDRISGGGSSVVSPNISSSSKNDAAHNITTVITLNNIINNTNIIDVPITLNNTNINNITVENSEQSVMSSSGGVVPHVIPQQPVIQQVMPPQQDNCCKIIGPRQCVQTQTFPFAKCFHYRKQHCGEICKTSIMHAEPHEVCDQVEGSTSCHQQIAYIPQPKPRCSYTSSWPYVSCKVTPSNCEGCYQHVVQGGSAPSHCSSSCYDPSYNVGPAYQTGPIFQPSYNPMPMCNYMGNCEIGGAYPQFFSGAHQQHENPMDMMSQVIVDRKDT